jgi:hypothetical protein
LAEKGLTGEKEKSACPEKESTFQSVVPFRQIILTAVPSSTSLLGSSRRTGFDGLVFVY